MANIFHRVGIKAPIQIVYKEIATVKGISSWWTESTSGDSQIGKNIMVQFQSKEGNEIGSMEMEVINLEENNTIQWKFIAGPEEWIGTEVVFKLYQDGEYTIVLFSHKNWKEEVEFMGHCNLKWGVFMLSLKELVENGKGRPSPNDIKIDNWN